MKVAVIMWLWAGLCLGIISYFGLFLFSNIACAPCQLLCGTYFGNPNFFKLTLRWIGTAGFSTGWIGGKQASKKPIPNQTQSFDYPFCTSWLGVCPRKGSSRRIQKREINQNIFLFPVTVLPTAWSTDFLHSRPCTGTIKASDVMNECQSSSF